MPPRLLKQHDVLIYEDPAAYVHNPVLEWLGNGELACMFREAKRRRHRSHIDLTSHAAMVRSHDGGRTWDPATHQVIFQREGWGVQDPSLRRLRDGTLLCNFFVWRAGGDDEVPVDHPWRHSSDAEHHSWVIGVFTIRSTDGGKTWSEPVQVPTLTGLCSSTSDPIVELDSGELLIPLEGQIPGERVRTMVARSRDGGKSWTDPVTTAFDPMGHVNFHETSLLNLGGGQVLAMHRTHELAERSYGFYFYQSNSTDNGKTWSPAKQTNVWGHPAHLLRLRSGAILLVYGHRRSPFGVRACLSHDDGKTWDIANECILRNDGIDKDVGYPTSVQHDDGAIFTAWYMTRPDADTKASTDPFFAYASPLAYLGGTFLREA